MLANNTSGSIATFLDEDITYIIWKIFYYCLLLLYYVDSYIAGVRTYVNNKNSSM